MVRERVVVSEDVRGRMVGWGKDRAKRKVEAVGWLIGRWEGSDAVVLDAMCSSVEPGSTMTGTRASGSEESGLSLSLPRGIGIVGLFHSHPFAKGERALFHSDIDDATLRTRSSSGRYVSLVTDCESVEAFLFESGKRTGAAEVVVECGQARPLKRAGGALELDERLWVNDFSNIADELRGLVEEVSVDEGGEGASRLGASGTADVSTTGTGFELALSVEVRPLAFPLDGTDTGELLRLEACDLLDMLVWSSAGAIESLARRAPSVHVDLGRIRYSEGPVAYKRFTPPKRRGVSRRRK